jgi:glycine/D-amino acid oxidase-like deaminating enzyme
MPAIDTIVVGAGQAGLAASRGLAARGRDHVVLERGRVGERWHSDTWDSLHLLTPNWMNTLPAWAYRGGDPDGFMSAAEFSAHLADYARSFTAPVDEDTRVGAVRRNGDGFVVSTDRGCYRAANVIVATGWCDQPAIPAVAHELDAGVVQVVPHRYRRPAELPPGGVLVVGASATGVQLADELRESGRDVTLAVGAHTRVPRRYRGIDIFWWLGRVGLLDRTIDQMPDAARARREPSLQLVGGPVHRSLDLTTLLAAASGSSAGWSRSTALGCGSLATSPTRSPTPTGVPPACWPRSTVTSTSRDSRTMSSTLNRWPGCCWSRQTRSSTCAPKGSPPSSGRPATDGTTTGCRSPYSTPPARSGSGGG